jgi:hypothetical protein
MLQLLKGSEGLHKGGLEVCIEQREHLKVRGEEG